MTTRPRLVCLVGPTASGKTALAVDLAETIGAEIVCADSRQVYRGMEIGTAKPTAVERGRVPHHGLDLAEPDDPLDAARFRGAAAAAIDDVLGRGRPVVVAGGTGLWIRALLHGLCPAPPADPAVRRVLRAWTARDGAPAMHARLVHVDPVAAGRIHPNDAVRVERALEVAFVSGRRLSAWQAAHGFGDAPWDVLQLGLAVPVATLDARIATRTAAMLEAGWLDEVRILAGRGYADDAPVWRTLGYPELRAVIAGTATVADAQAATVLATRRFARRQRTWFRGEPAVVWRDPEADRARILAEAAAFLARGARPEP